MKKQITLSEADGETVLGYLETGGLVVLVFEPGYVCIQADGFRELDTEAPLLFTEHEPEGLEAIGIGSVDEITATVAQIQADQLALFNKSRMKQARESLSALAKQDPAAASRLIAEAIQLYGVSE